MFCQFTAAQEVEILVPEQPVPIQHYLRQPQRLIRALVDSSRMEQLRQERFRLKMRPLDFLSVTLQPTVDLRVWAKPDGTVHLASVGCEIRGVEYINRRFSLDLLGKLAPENRNGNTYLKGRADLTVQVDVPPPLDLTPQPLLNAAGNGAIKSVLLAIEQRLTRRLLQDYQHWACGEIEVLAAKDVLSPNGQII